MSEYDVVIIGAGPGGYVAAIKAAQLGLKTAVIDKQWLGGVCLNVGCIPSKALLKNAELAYTLREKAKDFGISFDNLTLDYPAAVKRSRQVSDRLTKGVGFLMKKNNIDVLMGKARLVSKNQVAISLNDGTEQTVSTRNIIIATGASTSAIPGLSIDGKKIITYLEAILQTERPQRVIIIGAGAIGVEFATIWNSYGSKVTLVEMMSRIVPLEDEDVSHELTRAFTKKGIEVLTGYKVAGAQTSSDGVKVSLNGPDGEKDIEADQALVAIGFKPNSVDLGLETVGVKTNQRGHIEINEKMETSVSGIYAIGDVTGKFLLAHVASTQGIVAAEAISGKETTPIDYGMVPRATYSQPQIASFGYTEAQAREKGLDVMIAKVPFQAIGKAIALGDYAGFCKLIIDAKYGELIGAHLIGPEVCELLPELTIAQKMELTAEEISRNIHTHPTLSEILMESAHAILGAPIHT